MIEISENELERAHAAAKIIEMDAEEGFQTCCQKFGRDVAIALLVAFYRREFTSNNPFFDPLESSFPPSSDIDVATNELLRSRGHVRKNCPTCGK